MKRVLHVDLPATTLSKQKKSKIKNENGLVNCLVPVPLDHHPLLSATSITKRREPLGLLSTPNKRNVNHPHSQSELQVRTTCRTTVTTATTTATTTTTTSSFRMHTMTPKVSYVVARPVPSPLSWFANVIAEQPRSACTNTEVFNVQCQTPYNLVKRRHRGDQTGVKMVTKSTQTDQMIQPDSPKALNVSLNDSFLSEITSTTNDHRDQDWSPESDDSLDHLSDITTANEANEKKFIVFESQLDKLLSKCAQCGNDLNTVKRIAGTCVTYIMECISCDEKFSWCSQPMSGTMPCGNLVLAAAIMFAGASAAQVLKIFKFSSVEAISLRTYFSLQRSYLTPSILSVWEYEQAAMITSIKEEGRQLKLGGDGRCCSPGHTAKYGTYNVMDLAKGKILDIQLVQSNEVANSYAMELEGLKRSLAFLMGENQLQISDFITDRHSSVKKFFREQHPSINHWFDVWHVAKGVFKKLESSGKKKGCEKVKAWARSVSNHLYWCAASSGGDGELVQQKWFSILNHVVNIHEGHGQMFPNCLHGDLDDRDWMKKGFKPYAELEKVVKGRLLKEDVKKLSPAEQTSDLEGFHKVICSYAPKFVHYFHPQMEARTCLAALHFNENSGRKQLLTKNGDLQYSVSFPKAKRGEPIVKEIKVDQTFGYIDKLMDEVFLRREMNQSYVQAMSAWEIEDHPRPNPIAHSTPGKKADIVRSHKSRFNH